MFLIKRLKCRRKSESFKGMSFVETLILLIIVALAIGAILLTVSSSVNMYTAAKSNLNARILANSWFEAFETIPPETIDSSFTMEKAADEVAGFLHGTGSYPKYVFPGHRMTVAGDVNDGVCFVTLGISTSDTGASLFNIERSINARFNDSVSDDKPGGGLT